MKEITNKELVCKKLIKIMKYHRITQKQVAHVLGISQSCLSKYLACAKGYSITNEMLTQICEAINVPLDEIQNVKVDITDINSEIDIKELFEMMHSVMGYNITHNVEKTRVDEDGIDYLVTSNSGVLTQTVIADEEDEYYIIECGGNRRKFTPAEYDEYIKRITEINTYFIEAHIR